MDFRPIADSNPGAMSTPPFTISPPFCQAGLAGYSDRAMRVVARRRGCPYAVTEALLDVILLSGGRGLRQSIDINPEDHPVAGQLIGSEPGELARAANILHRAGYDVIDLNFACPVKKVKARARGGHMLTEDSQAVDILRAVRDALPPGVPTTVSLRRAFDDTPEATERFERIFESAFEYGYSAARVHARTVAQKYLGRSDWGILAELKRRHPTRMIFGSGDVFTAEDAARMKRQTGVDVVWIARGAIGNPWIFRHAAMLWENPSLTMADIAPPTIAEQRAALEEHFAIAMQIHGEELAGRRMRKMGIKYARFHPEHGRVKDRFIQVRSLREWTNVLDDFYKAEGPGVWPDPRAADEVNEGCD